MENVVEWLWPACKFALLSFAVLKGFLTAGELLQVQRLMCVKPVCPFKPFALLGLQPACCARWARQRAAACTVELCTPLSM
jgi:hypothetical protein